MQSKNGLTLSILLIALLFSLAVSFAYLMQPAFLSSTNARTTDVVMALAQTRHAPASVVIVDIDERSLGRYGQWPWSRYRIAQMLRAINDSGAASIGVDLILAEPDRSSPIKLQTDGNRAPGSRSAPSGSRAELVDHDRYLADTLTRGPYVLGYEFLFGNRLKPQRRCRLHPPGVVWIGKTEAIPESYFFEAQGVVCNRPLFDDAVRRSGFLNATPDADGVLRRVPMLIRFEDRLYPSLDLAMLMQYVKSGQVEIRQGEGGNLDLRVGNRSVAVDSHGNMIVQFSYRSKAAARVSAAELLDGKVTPDKLKGKAVLVGSSAAGMQPVYQTSAGPVHSHADIQARALDNMLAGQEVIRTGRFLVWEAMLGMLAALCTGWAIARLAIVPSAVACATLLAACWVGMELVFQTSGYLLSPLLPSVLVVWNYANLTIFKTWRIQLAALQKLEEVNMNLERRVADAVSDLRDKDRIMMLQGRQAAMGEMIGNIAHQWRQPLNTLGLIVQGLRMTYGSEEFNKESLDASVKKAMKLIQHMSQTIEDFSNYFKPDKEKKRFNVNQSVAKTLSLIEPSLKNLDIGIETMERDNVDIDGYPNEYSQVLLNILLNCRDAFEGGASERQRVIRIGVFKENDKSVVTVADNAGGIPEAIIDKIFDPYFTTKGPDKGTGIGLYMAKTIIEKNMGGRLTARNTADGAEFRVEV